MTTDPTQTPDRFRPRFDVSQVRPQGGYVAKRCPLRVQYDAFPPEGFIEVPADEASEARMQRGREFEVEVFVELERLHGASAVRLDRSVHASMAEREAATLEAMGRGVELILGGRLPADMAGRRVGEPDVLARAERRPDGRWAYHPIDVKHHRTLDAKEGGSAPIAGLAHPFRNEAVVAEDTVVRENRGDLLQLSHYVRVLDACAHSSAEPFGAIIGSESTVTWMDLATPRIGRTWSKEKDSALESYDFEFSFRLDVLAGAMAGQPLVEPMWCSECSTCPWSGKCEPDLVAADSVSFLPRSSYKQWHALRRNSLDRRDALAAVEERWVRFLAAYPDKIQDLAAQAAAHPANTPVDAVVGRRSAKRLKALEDAGLRTAGDVAQIPEWVNDLAGRGVKSLTALWQGARVVAWGKGAPHIRPGINGVAVPSATLEIDIDMESGLDGSVYLWGTLRNDQYLPFVSWNPDPAAAEEECFRSFWGWLEPLIEASLRGGPSLAVYCWSEGAENRALRNGARQCDEGSRVAEFGAAVNALIASDSYIDLMKVYDDHLITGSGAGLKRVAPLAGFAWRDADPGGDASMLRHAAAVDPATPEVEAKALRQRLLDYNEDDVRATAAIRDWMRRTEFPRFDSLKVPPE